jgi:hypothetical protein
MIGMPNLNVAQTDSSSTAQTNRGNASGGGSRGVVMTVATGKGKATTSINDMPQWILWAAGGLAALAVLWFIFRKKGKR